jgi:hypothetical protein
MRRRVLVAFAIAALTVLGLASGAQAAPIDVTFTVVNQRGINQFSYIKFKGSPGFYNITDGNGQFSASVSSCVGKLGPCVEPGDHIYFSRDEGLGGPCAAPEDPTGLEYVVTGSPSQTITLYNTTGESNHTSPTNTESWIVGRLNQDRAAHNPPLAALHVSSVLTRAAYAVAHDRALAPGHPYPPAFCNVNVSDWGWPAPGFVNEDSGNAAPEMTLAHWDGSAGDAESVNLANHGVYDAANTAVGVADGGGTWIIEYNNCSSIAPAFAGRCGMTSDTGNPYAYTPASALAPPPIGGGSGGVLGSTSKALAAPIFAQTASVQLISGVVLIELPGSNSFIPLSASTTVPIGAVIDATNGTVQLTSADARGHIQTGLFYGGSFRVTQITSRSGLRGAGTVAMTVLTLAGPQPGGCKAKRASHAAGLASSHPKSRRLWGNGKGNFRTVGHYASATVRGTKWLTEDTCAGTLVRVARGVVSVADFPHHRTLLLRAGHSVLSHLGRGG